MGPHVGKGHPSIECEDMSLERQLQVKSIIRVVRDSLEKLQIALLLPHIFENLITVRQRLKGTDFEHYVDMIENYIIEKKTDPCSTPPHLDYRLIKIIDLFQENHQILSYFLDWENDLSEDDKSFIDYFQLLVKITGQRLKKSALSEIKKEKIIHEVFHENERCKKRILDFERTLKKQRINLRWQAAAKETVIQKYEKDLAALKYENNIKIKQAIVHSSQNIRQINATSVIKQKELEEELEKVKISYEHLLAANLKQERAARDERNKLLLQLQALLKKFDQTISDKVKESMLLQEELKKQEESMEEFLVEYQREENEYIRIVRSKEDQERRQQEERILLFMMNRSARIIQKFWRKFVKAQKKAAKKASKKGKGKKK